MSTLDKLKLAIWLKGLLEKVAVAAPKAVQKIDGYKSVLGALIVIAYYVLPLYTKIAIPDFVYKFGLSLVSVGLVHKLEEYTGWVSVALQGLQKALAAMTAPK